MSRLAPLLALILLAALPAGRVAAAPLTLASIETYFVDFQPDADMAECRVNLIKALHDNLIKTTPERSQADAIYRVNINKQDSSWMRETLTWHAEVQTLENRILLNESAVESGWSLKAACIDAVEDIAQELGERVRRARVNRASIPLPEIPRKADVAPTKAPAIELPSETVIKERPIRGESEPDYELPSRRLNEFADQNNNELKLWRRAAEEFARKNGCSDKFSSVHSLPSGARMYVTHCGRSERNLIICTSLGKCDLDI